MNPNWDLSYLYKGFDDPAFLADLKRFPEEIKVEQAILDGKTEVEKERYSSGQKFVMDAGKLLERGKLIDIRPHTRFIRFPAHSHNYVEMIYMCRLSEKRGGTALLSALQNRGCPSGAESDRKSRLDALTSPEQ